MRQATPERSQVENEQDSDDEHEQDAAQREAERHRIMKAAGLVARKSTRRYNKRKPPAPPQKASELPDAGDVGAQVAARRSDNDVMEEEPEPEEPMSPEEQVLSKTEDAYARWQATRSADAPLITQRRPPSSVADDFYAAAEHSQSLSPSRPPSRATDSSGLLSKMRSRSSSLTGGSSEGASISGRAMHTTSPVLSIQVGLAVVSELRAKAERDSDNAQTWSSLIDSSSLADIPEEERKRQEAIFELIMVGFALE